jgi:hypothetical protein
MNSGCLLNLMDNGLMLTRFCGRGFPAVSPAASKPTGVGLS